jgi:hypothetical protein
MWVNNKKLLQTRYFHLTAWERIYLPLPPLPAVCHPGVLPCHTQPRCTGIGYAAALGSPAAPHVHCKHKHINHYPQCPIISRQHSHTNAKVSYPQCPIISRQHSHTNAKVSYPHCPIISRQHSHTNAKVSYPQCPIISKQHSHTNTQKSATHNVQLSADSTHTQTHKSQLPTTSH